MKALRRGLKMMLWVALVTTGRVAGQEAAFVLVPNADGLTLESAPSATLGTAGALHVAGADAVNGQGATRGAADSWLRFDTGAAAVAFDATFGAGNWSLGSATLIVEEVGVPRNAIFAVGVGAFDVWWVADDGWTEGSGRPSSMGSSMGNALSYDSSRGRLDASVDVVLGSFSNAGANGTLELALTPADGFAADVADGGDVTLVVRSEDRSIGFTFHSRSWRSENGRPQLALTAVPAAPSGGGGVDAGGDASGNGGAVDGGSGGGGGTGGGSVTPPDGGGVSDGGTGDLGNPPGVGTFGVGDSMGPGGEQGAGGAEPVMAPMCGVSGMGAVMMVPALLMMAWFERRSVRGRPGS